MAADGPEPERVAALGAATAHAVGTQVPSPVLENVLAYLDAMLAENARVNLTAIRDPDDALVLHALDSLAIAPDLESVDTRRVLDLGTGNGFPGVVVGLLAAGAKVTLLDRTRRKIAAIERALVAAGISEPRATLEPLHADAQQLPAIDGFAPYSCVVCRAVAEPEPVGKLTARLLERGGELLLWVAADTTTPARLGATFDKVDERGYELPASERRAMRARRIVRYARR